MLPLRRNRISNMHTPSSPHSFWSSADVSGGRNGANAISATARTLFCSPLHCSRSCMWLMRSYLLSPSSPIHSSALSSMQLKCTMFREYDIRGKEADDELNVTSMYHIARGFGVMLKQKGNESAIAGHDARATSESFHAAALHGLTDSGVEVIDIDTVTTPMGYWAQYHFHVKGLCMVTASHNPAGWNGVKLGIGLSQTLLPSDVQELYSIIEKEDYRKKGAIGGIRQENITEAYMEDLVSRVHLHRPLKVLVNTGNGTAGRFAPEILRRAGVAVVEHLTNIDPSYPHYTANPDGTAMMQDTGAQTVKNTCDIAVPS